MGLHRLKKSVYRANLELRDRGLVLYTWGNVSAIDRDRGLVVIKPSGVSYDDMTPDDMVAVDLTGKVAEGNLKPSSDTPTHLVLYRAFPGIGGIVHTHSTWATVWAQCGQPIPCMGTTHADYFYGPVPCTRPLTTQQIRGEYEAETGNAIVEAMDGINPVHMPAALAAGHGPFTWGGDAAEAVYHAVVLEQVAHMAWASRQLDPGSEGIDSELLERHFMRKHGENAYYGNT